MHSNKNNKFFRNPFYCFFFLLYIFTDKISVPFSVFRQRDIHFYSLFLHCTLFFFFSRNAQTICRPFIKFSVSTKSSRCNQNKLNRNECLLNCAATCETIYIKKSSRRHQLSWNCGGRKTIARLAQLQNGENHKQISVNPHLAEFRNVSKN